MNQRTDADAVTAYQVSVRLSMAPAHENAFKLEGPHTFDAAMALVNMGLELFLFLGRHDPVTRATAIALVRKMPSRFDSAARDPSRPTFETNDPSQ